MEPYLVAISHPSLERAVLPFLEAIGSERRRFGRLASCDPKPFPSLVRKIVDPERIRFGVVVDGRVVGMASIAHDGELSMAVAADQRGHGIGTMLMERAIEVAAVRGMGCLRMSSSHRSRPVAALAARHGWTVVDLGRGRLELLLDVVRRLDAV